MTSLEGIWIVQDLFLMQALKGFRDPGSVWDMKWTGVVYKIRLWRRDCRQVQDLPNLWQEILAVGQFIYF